MTRWPVAFGRFWWDFIVGDSIVLAIGGPAILVFAYALAHAGDQMLAQVLLPVGVITTLVLSLAWRSV